MTSSVVEALAADAHEWVSFTDGDGDTWLFDLTFLASNWNCIYGAGCPGVHAEPTPERAEGCCSFGAHFSDEPDRDRVARAAARLSPDQWQHRPPSLDDAFETDENGIVTTVLADEACVFLNRPGFPAGAGCALHQAAEDEHERPLDWKPEVCWQLPLRLDHHVDDNRHSTWMLRAWDRRDWGEGGAEFHWWCTEDPLAFASQVPVFEAMEDEIVEMVGSDAYAMLLRHVERVDHRRLLPHPVSVPVELTVKDL